MLGLVLAEDRAVSEAPGEVLRGSLPWGPLTQGSAGVVLFLPTDLRLAVFSLPQG